MADKLENIDFEAKIYKGNFKGNLMRALNSRKIATYQDLTSYSRHELLSMSGVGTESMFVLLKDLENRGYKLRGE